MSFTSTIFPIGWKVEESIGRWYRVDAFITLRHS